MLRARHRKSLLLVSLGLLMGLLAGVVWHYSVVGTAPLEELKLRAAASHGSETFAMATGRADENDEVVFMLDYLTGDLTAVALNARGEFFAAFKTNVIKDLPVEKGKKPSYVMCTGSWNSTRGGATGNVRPAGCVLYVADCNSGYFAAYTIPWNTNAANQGGKFALPMYTLATGKARDLKLRE